MKTLVQPTSEIAGSLNVPSDKSLTHRAIFLSALSRGVSTIKNPLLAEDCLSSASCMEALGCNIERTFPVWKVHGVGLWGFKAPTAPLNCGNSGTTMRLISGIMAAQDFPVTLVGDVSLSSRPMRRVADPLRAMGAHVELHADKYAPLRIQGTSHLKPISWKSEVSSAQVKSCLLLAGLHAKGETSFFEPRLSRDHTERMLKSCGVSIRRSGTEVFVKGPAVLTPQDWEIPGDISSAAFFLVASALIKKSDVQLQNVILNPTRTGLLDVMKAAGVSFRMENLRDVGGEPVGDIQALYADHVNRFHIDDTLAPRLIDEVPILAVLATQAVGTSVFRGLEELRVKETDRLKAMAENLTRMGAHIKETNDGLVIEGPTKLKGASVKSFGDHRIAMSMAVAGLIAEGPTEIEESEAVSISFPDFWDKIKQLKK